MTNPKVIPEMVEAAMDAYDISSADYFGQMEKALEAALSAQPSFEVLRPMESAPKDGTEILAWCEHQLIDSPNHKAWVVAKWINHNGGGWTWHGLCGEFLGWLPMPPRPTKGAKQ